MHVRSRALRSTTLILLVTVGFTSVAAAQTSQPDRGEFDAAVALLRDAALRMDSPGIQFLKGRFEPFLDEPGLVAEAQYQMGFADLASLFSPDMSNRTAGPEETMQRIERAIDTLAASTEQDATRLETWCMLALAERVHATVVSGEKQRDMLAASEKHLAKASAIDENHPEVLAAIAMCKLFGGDTTAMAPLEASVEAYRRQISGDRSTDAGWWPLMARSMLAQMDRFSGRASRALELIEECLSLEPDFPMAAQMKPGLEATVAAMGEGYPALDIARLPKATWTVLSEDPSDDVRDATLADGKTFAYWLDASTETVWFRFELHKNLHPEAFGVNLVVDDDADQATGTGWWGTNTVFTMDRLVTVWVTLEDNGKYIGTVGVSDLDNLNQRDFAGLHRGGIDFVTLKDRDAIVVGLPASYLSDGPRVNIIGAVGSNAVWNDDLQDEGYATIDLR